MPGPYDHLDDEQLRRLEEWLYDAELDGQDTWRERDQILHEMNRRRIAGTVSSPRENASG